MLDTATTGEITMLYKEIVPRVCTLAKDAFGNYVIQKVFFFPTLMGFHNLNL
jgi:hypothetical protein